MLCHLIYTVTGDFVDSSKCVVTVLAKQGSATAGASTGTTYQGVIVLSCGFGGNPGPYSGTVSMTTTGGGTVVFH